MQFDSSKETEMHIHLCVLYCFCACLNIHNMTKNWFTTCFYIILFGFSYENTFNRSTTQTLRIVSIIYNFQGQDLSHVGIDNYFVNIGTGIGNCKVIRVEVNTLTCQPPNLEPDANQSFGNGIGEPRVYVTILLCWPIMKRYFSSMIFVVMMI